MMTDTTKSLVIPNHILSLWGCKNCVWKLHHQCPHNISDDQIYSFNDGSDKQITGYCPEFAEFLFSLSDGDQTLSCLKEKFLLYTQELQAMSDQMEYHKIHKEYNEMKDNPEVDQKTLNRMFMIISSYRLWWMNLTSSVIKGLSKINDRDARKLEQKDNNSLNVQQLNLILNNSSKVLLENNKEP